MLKESLPLPPPRAGAPQVSYERRAGAHCISEPPPPRPPPPQSPPAGRARSGAGEGGAPRGRGPGAAIVAAPATAAAEAVAAVAAAAGGAPLSCEQHLAGVAASRPGAGPPGWSPRRPGPTQFPRHRVTEAGGRGTRFGAGAGCIFVRRAALGDSSPGRRANGTRPHLGHLKTCAQGTERLWDPEPRPLAGRCGSLGGVLVPPLREGSFQKTGPPRLVLSRVLAPGACWSPGPF